MHSAIPYMGTGIGFFYVKGPATDDPKLENKEGID